MWAHCSFFILVSQSVSANLCSPSFTQAYCSYFVLISQFMSADMHSPSLAQAHCSYFVLVSQWVGADLHSPFLARAHCSCFVLWNPLRRLKHLSHAALAFIFKCGHPITWQVLLTLGPVLDITSCLLNTIHHVLLQSDSEVPQEGTA